MKERIITLLVALFFVFGNLYSQSMSLANQYFADGEYEKAAVLYHKLWTQNKGNEVYLARLTDCYIVMDDLKTALSVVDDAVKNNPQLPTLRITKAALLIKMDRADDADKEMKNVLSRLPNDPNMLLRTAHAFDRMGKTEYAIETLEQGEKIMDADGLFASDLAFMYNKTGQRTKMLATQINILRSNPAMLHSVQSMIQRSFSNESEYDELLPVVFEKLQSDPQNPQLIEFLAWIYIQKKDFRNALRQLRALDMQSGNHSIRVFNLARTAYNESQYDIAMDGYKYLIDKGTNNPYLFESLRYYLLSLTSSKIVNSSIDSNNLGLIDTEYRKIMNDYRETGRAVYVAYDYAAFLLMYHNNLDSAITTLEHVLEWRNIAAPARAEIKIRLADYQLMKGERWDASLLYSQVDKDFKEEPLGQEARYKNAKLSYYVGDFEWAQAQFNVLKTATSRMIANDAIDRSVFIMDNIGLDTTDAALKIYAATELLIYCNQLDEALRKLDNLLEQFPGNSLDDDVLYAKAQIYVKQHKFSEAIEAYSAIIADYKDEIRADNALYELAQLYDHTLNQPEKARDLYEQLFNDFSDSVLAFDARQRFRILRGDSVQ